VAGRIILLDDFHQFDTGTQSVSAVFLFELGPAEIKTVNGVNVKPTSASILFNQQPFLFRHNLISIDEQTKLDDGVLIFVTRRLVRHSDESDMAVRDKLRTEYISARAEYLTYYISRYAFAGVDISI